MTRVKPTGRPHLFVRDPELPHADQFGRRVCRTCHLVGEPGDAHHAMPAAVEDARSLAAGERGDER